jgi:hypothetical protein
MEMKRLNEVIKNDDAVADRRNSYYIISQLASMLKICG